MAKNLPLPCNCQSCEVARQMETFDQKTALQIYDLLRAAHASIKTIQQNINFKDLGELDNAIDGVDSVLYMAETIVMQKMEK